MVEADASRVWGMTLAFPKPQKRAKGRKAAMLRKSRKKAHTGLSDAERAHMGAVKGLDCIICHAPAPSDAHHVFHDRHSQKKASGYATISLCKNCHQWSATSVHRNKRGWAVRHGPDWSYIPIVLDLLGISTDADFD